MRETARGFARLSTKPWRVPIVVPGCPDAGVDGNGGAGDAGCERRSDEGDRRGDVARRQHATERVALGVGAEDLVAIGEGRQAPLEKRRERDARADAIDANLVAGEVERGGPGEVEERPLRRAVGEHAVLGLEAVEARQKHDRTGAARAHLPRRLAPQQERAAHIDAHHLLEIVERRLEHRSALAEDARTGDRDVYWSKLLPR